MCFYISLYAKKYRYCRYISAIEDIYSDLSDQIKKKLNKIFELIIERT